jgi:UDP-N-acetylglucosamine acyltransferase
MVLNVNRIHPTAIIGSSVVLGDNNVIGPNVVIVGKTKIGDDNWIGPGSSIGITGDILGQPSSVNIPFWEIDTEVPEFGVKVGNHNVIKENVTIHAGSHRDTEVGNDCYLMPRSHLGHDCWLGDNILLSPNSQVAGHVSIGSRAVIGMGALIHQFSNIGPVSMVGMGCCVRGDVEICRTVVGEPHKVTGINKVGIKRLVGESEAPKVMAALKTNDVLNLPEPLKTMVSNWRSQIVTH